MEAVQAAAAYLNRYGKQRELYHWGWAPLSDGGYELRSFAKFDEDEPRKPDVRPQPDPRTGPLGRR